MNVIHLSRYRSYIDPNTRVPDTLWVLKYGHISTAEKVTNIVHGLKYQLKRLILEWKFCDFQKIKQENPDAWKQDQEIYDALMVYCDTIFTLFAFWKERELQAFFEIVCDYDNDNKISDKIYWKLEEFSTSFFITSSKESFIKIYAFLTSSPIGVLSEAQEEKLKKIMLTHMLRNFSDIIWQKQHDAKQLLFHYSHFFNFYTSLIDIIWGEDVRKELEQIFIKSFGENISLLLSYTFNSRDPLLIGWLFDLVHISFPEHLIIRHFYLLYLYIERDYAHNSSAQEFALFTLKRFWFSPQVLYQKYKHFLSLEEKSRFLQMFDTWYWQKKKS